jgi:hypothetical protein
MNVDTSNNDTIYNRIYTVSNFTGNDINPILKLTYATNATTGNPQFVFEARTNLTESKQPMDSPFAQFGAISSNESQSINSVDLGNTLGYLTIRSYELPTDIVNETSEFRFYVITNGSTIADFTLKNATIS